MTKLYIGPYISTERGNEEISLNGQIFYVSKALKLFFDLKNRPRKINERALKRYCKHLQTKKNTDDLYVILLCFVRNNTKCIWKSHPHPYKKINHFKRLHGWELCCDKCEFEFFTALFLNLTYAGESKEEFDMMCKKMYDLK